MYEMYNRCIVHFRMYNILKVQADSRKSITVMSGVRMLIKGSIQFDACPRNLATTTAFWMKVTRTRSIDIDNCTVSVTFTGLCSKFAWKMLDRFFILREFLKQIFKF